MHQIRPLTVAIALAMALSNAQAATVTTQSVPLPDPNPPTPAQQVQELEGAINTDLTRIQAADAEFDDCNTLTAPDQIMSCQIMALGERQNASNDLSSHYAEGKAFYSNLGAQLSDAMADLQAMLGDGAARQALETRKSRIVADGLNITRDIDAADLAQFANLPRNVQVELTKRVIDWDAAVVQLAMLEGTETAMADTLDNWTAWGDYYDGVSAELDINQYRTDRQIETTDFQLAQVEAWAITNNAIAQTPAIVVNGPSVPDWSSIRVPGGSTAGAAPTLAPMNAPTGVQGLVDAIIDARGDQQVATPRRRQPSVPVSSTTGGN